MSMYSLCSEACDRLISGESVGPHSPFFTEIDVVNIAAQLARSEWGKSEFKSALRPAQDAVGTKWREGKLCRYGPVSPPGVREGDYARIASKIVYASRFVDAPTRFKTPNGDFPAFAIGNDPLKRQGRRTGTNRNDLQPWSEQDIRPVQVTVAPIAIGRKPIQKIKDDSDLWGLVEDLSTRLEALEERERAREKVYTTHE